VRSGPIYEALKDTEVTYRKALSKAQVDELTQIIDRLHTPEEAGQLHENIRLQAPKIGITDVQTDELLQKIEDRLPDLQFETDWRNTQSLIENGQHPGFNTATMSKREREALTALSQRTIQEIVDGSFTTHTDLQKRLLRAYAPGRLHGFVPPEVQEQVLSGIFEGSDPESRARYLTTAFTMLDQPGRFGNVPGFKGRAGAVPSGHACSSTLAGDHAGADDRGNRRARSCGAAAALPHARGGAEEDRRRRGTRVRHPEHLPGNQAGFALGHGDERQGGHRRSRRHERRAARS
jgi:hypothetical protein